MRDLVRIAHGRGCAIDKGGKSVQVYKVRLEVLPEDGRRGGIERVCVEEEGKGLGVAVPEGMKSGRGGVEQG